MGRRFSPRPSASSTGRLDVVIAPEDGGLTLPLPEMIEVLKHVRSAMLIPLHWFSMASLEGFLAGMEDQFRIEVHDEPFIDVAGPLRSMAVGSSSACS